MTRRLKPKTEATRRSTAAVRQVRRDAAITASLDLASKTGQLHESVDKALGELAEDMRGRRRGLIKSLKNHGARAIHRQLINALDTKLNDLIQEEAHAIAAAVVEPIIEQARAALLASFARRRGARR